MAGPVRYVAVVTIDHDALVAEIHALHTDLADWLGTPERADALERFIGQTHPDFSMVTLDGTVVRRAGLLGGLGGAGNSAPGLGIDIVDIEVLHRSSDCAVARFAEIHHGPGGAAKRLTTAVFLPDPQGRNGLLWRSVHETASLS